MKNQVTEIKDMKDVRDIRDVQDMSSALTRENKRYVIAVANALLFSQNSENHSCGSSDK